MKRCPTCHTPVDGARNCVGVVMLQPCAHWLTPDQVTAAGLDGMVAPAPKVPRR